MEKVTCTICPNSCIIYVNGDEMNGYKCDRGIVYAKTETTNPTRNISSTVKIKNAPFTRVPVKTDKPIDKKLILAAMEQLNSVELISPVKIGDVAFFNILNTGVNFVVTRNM